jgi:Tol biopolymer transport system component
MRSLADGRVRDLAVPTRIPSAQLSWSPDGRRLALKGFFGEDWGVHLLDAATGARVERIAVPASSRFVEERIGQAVWSPAGDTLVLVRDRGIAVIDLASRRVEDPVPPGDDRVWTLAVAPDGRTVACSVQRADRRWAIRVVDIDARQTREVMVADSEDALMVETWTPDGSDILFTRFRLDIPWKDRRERLWRVAGDGAARPTGLEVAGMREVRMHPDGRRVAFTAGYRSLELWALEGLGRELAALRR